VTGARAPSALYRAPTESAPSEVVLEDGTLLRGLLHLHADAHRPGGFESVQHLLDDPEPFFAVTLEGGHVALVGKAHTVGVRCDAHHEDELPGTTEVLLEVVLSTGERRTGRAVWGARPTQSRALDLLNASRSFLRLVDERGASYLNLAHLRVAFPVD